jgi:hypothetical protein
MLNLESKILLHKSGETQRGAFCGHDEDEEWEKQEEERRTEKNE